MSQYAQNLARGHYEAVIKIFHYLNATIERGIYYWHPNDNQYLPLAPIPTPKPQSHIPSHVQHNTPATLTGMVDLDWAGDVLHRKSVTGIALKVAGRCALYKTKYQDTIALSSTEAEFAAACEAGKSLMIQLLVAFLGEIH